MLICPLLCICVHSAWTWWRRGNSILNNNNKNTSCLALQSFAFTLRGLVKRMARLADNARFGMRQQRMAALRWLGAVATTLGGVCVFGHVCLVVDACLQLRAALRWLGAVVATLGGV